LADVDASDFENLLVIRDETLDDTPVYHLKGELHRGVLGDKWQEGAKMDFWIAEEDFLMRRVSFEGETTLGGGDPFFGGATGSTATIRGTMDFSDFNTPVVIEAPK